MADNSKTSLRIDWFDGSLVEDAKPSTSHPEFDKEEEPHESTNQTPAQTEKKPIGFKRLLEISLMEPDKLTLEVSYRPGFWNLFDQEKLKGDFIVLIVKILATVFRTIKIGEFNLKMTKLLEVKFLHSDFLEKLIDYVSELPNVKIVDKKMNTQLWDDVETFFFNAVSLCEGIFAFSGKKSKGMNKKLDKLLKALLGSAVGVQKEHSESFRRDLFDRISKLENKIEDDVVPVTAVDTHLKDSFKNLNIFPTRHNLISPDIIAGRPDLVNAKINDNIFQRNIKIIPFLDRGAYPNVEHYLDVQFRLLREDYFGPLREGICKYLENPSKTKHENIRVYKEVRVLGIVVKNNKVGHLVDFARKEYNTSKGDIKEKQYSKQLMFGSLLLFTSDNFHTILCATVLDSDLVKLRGCINVSFQNPVSKNILSETYLMVESEVFFEPYHRVLKVLQQSRLDDMPMKKYIVDVKPETQPPAYLTSETMYTIETPDRSEIPFPVLATDQWPTEHLGLDDSQLEAYKFALTREFAVIQGPPGTGKTFIGIKIASTILKNLSLEGTPMLIICYTNHALDQFLEGIINVTDSVIRLGSQSKSEKLEPYTLKNVKANMKYNNPFYYASKKNLQAIYEEISELHSEIAKCHTGILCYRHIKPYLKIDGKVYELKRSEEDSVLSWLFEHLEDASSFQEPTNDAKEDTWESITEMHLTEGKVEECFSEDLARKQVESIRGIIEQLAVHVNNPEVNNEEKIAVLEKRIERILKRIDCFKTNMTTLKNERKEYKIDMVDDLYKLNTLQRWQMYFNAVNKVRDELLTKMDVSLEKQKTATDELEELSTMIDNEVIRTARVVGVTTTAAARRHLLIKKMRSPIVIVEEAAEVLEAHIIASLTFALQHLILIGDHKQLRPTAANYKLAKECNFEVSLFERMIRSGIHARTLTTQRRMRPDFVQLLVPEIYPRLDSHDCVLNYRNVKGMGKNLFFLTHEVFEDTEFMDDSWSHENKFEAEWCIALARYLRKKGYKANDITILATYNGQVSQIKKISRTFESLRNIKITAVDNFQGEESRIVILSLVRSNRDGKIGFLYATNRICVALSRAKEGFYIFGNMTMLSKASPMWMSIYKKLIAQDAIGDKLYIEKPVRTAAELVNLYLV